MSHPLVSNDFTSLLLCKVIRKNAETQKYRTEKQKKARE